MLVFRIEREKYVKDTLRGIGASLSTGARWNSFGTPLVYTAESRALSTLEVSVHLDLSEDLPTDRMMIEIEIPDDLNIIEISLSDLPKNWDAKPPIQITQFIGDDFVVSHNACVLKVPSSIIPQEFNYLINPNHSDFHRIKVIKAKPFLFDSRMNA